MNARISPHENGYIAPGSGRAIAVLQGETVHWREPRELGLALPPSGRACVLAPSEQVLLVVVDLPLSSHRQRLEAVPFAVEGMLAEPLSAVHVVLGPQVAPKRYLAAVVRHDLMARWSQTLAKAGLAAARILPDALALPTPEDGWAVLSRHGRVVVRRSDGSGFAIGQHALEAAWTLAGRPALTSHGDALPDRFTARQADIAAEVPEVDAVAAGFDLRQGAHADRTGGSGFLRRAGWIVGLGAAALSGIFVVDTIALDRLAGERRAEAQELVRRIAPDTPAGGDVAAQLTRLLPVDGGEQSGRFLPFLASVSKALNAQPDAIAVQTLRYDAVDGALTLDLTADNLAALQRIEAAMIGAGLQATSGVATAESGGAEVSIVVTDNGAGGGS